MEKEILLLMAYAAPFTLILGGYWYWNQRKHTNSLRLQNDAISAGLTEAPTLHPEIDGAKCIGCGACVNACPESNVLGLISKKATLIGPTHCIGHGACKKACPVGAIELVFGSATRGIDIPMLNEDFQTSVTGMYIAGELGGMGLIRNAIEQGRQAIEEIFQSLSKKGVANPNAGSNDVYDVIIVGAGPAGLAAALGAKERQLKYLVLEQESELGGTVAHFPRGKLVMTQPAVLPLVGKVKITETTKEALLEFWQEVLSVHPIDVAFSSAVQNITRHGDGFEVVTQKSNYRSRRILLAIGRRGTPRKLDIPGEESNKVCYRLIDAEQYQNQHVLVVGGGDSALEAAIAIAEQPQAVVTLVYRGAAFSRAKPKNRDRIQACVDNGSVQVYLNTQPTEIKLEAVVIKTESDSITIKNDAVIVCVGGELPTGFLKKIGIEVETKYGTA